MAFPRLEDARWGRLGLALPRITSPTGVLLRPTRQMPPAHWLRTSDARDGLATTALGRRGLKRRAESGQWPQRRACDWLAVFGRCLFGAAKLALRPMRLARRERAAYIYRPPQHVKRGSLWPSPEHVAVPRRRARAARRPRAPEQNARDVPVPLPPASGSRVNMCPLRPGGRDAQADVERHVLVQC